MSWTDVKVTRLWFSPISGTSSGSAPRRKKRRTVHVWHSPQALASTQGRSLHPAGVCRFGPRWVGTGCRLGFLKTKYAVWGTQSGTQRNTENK